MKGKRLIDVLEDELNPKHREFWNKVYSKMNILLVHIEKTNPSIDDAELRWVSDRVEYWNAEERLLSKEEMEMANKLWRKYA